MFPSLTTCYASGVVLGEWQRRQLPAFVGVDLAGDKRPGNAITVLGLDPVTKRRYMLEAPMFGAWKSPETAGHIGDLCARHNVRFIMVENNAYQQSLVDWIRHALKQHDFWFKVESFTTGSNKANPTYGLPSLEVEFKNQAWVIPRDEFEGHDPACRCGWCVWIRQMRLYPRGAASDGVMSAWFAREAISRWGGFASNQSAITGNFNNR